MNTENELVYSFEIEERDNGIPVYWFLFERYPSIKFCFENVKFLEYNEETEVAKIVYDLDYKFQESDNDEVNKEFRETIESTKFQECVDVLLTSLVKSLANDQSDLDNQDSVESQDPQET